MIEVTVAIAIIICIIVAFVAEHKIPSPPVIIPTKVAIRPKKRSKAKSEPDPAWDAAKANLMIMGYSATEAKNMLKGLKCSTPEQYINQAMRRVKI